MRKPSVRKFVKYAIVLVVLGIVGGELFARFYLGLGTPPLYMAHSDIEYLMQPNQDVMRFGNRVRTNEWCMRSEPFSVHKASEDEFRVIVIGDSVLNGGALSDQAELATTKLEVTLESELGRPVTVGNVSAGSWGPENWRAYVDVYGTFDADLVVLLCSSHDADDVPTFDSLNPITHPTRYPVSALLEGIERYGLPRLKVRLGLSGDGSAETEIDAEQKGSAIDSLGKFIDAVLEDGPSLVVLQHPTRSENERGVFESGHELIKAKCQEKGVKVVDLAPYLASCESNPWRDAIHINAVGQAALHDGLRDICGEFLQQD